MRTSKPVLVRALFLVLLLAFSYPVMAQLKAGFTSSSPSGCAPLVVTFTDASKGSPTSWKWDLGNGVTSSDANPTTSYFDPGVYTVKLVVYTNDNKSDSVTQTNFVTVYQNPSAAFSISDSAGCFPLNVSYTDKSLPGSGDIAKRTWDFGDGNISAQAQPSHSYTAAGTFSVTLTVTNTFGCAATTVHKDVIHISQGVTAGFTANTTGVCHSPAVFNFTNTSVGAGALTYKWGFGDGAVATGDNPGHSYTNEGSYQVYLKVSAPGGCTDSISKPVQVSFVKAKINVYSTICVNSLVTFTNASSPQPYSAVWSFGDGTTGNNISPAKIYSKVGTYPIKQISTFFPGCIDSATTTVKVVDAITPSFKISDTAGCSLPFTAHFTNTTPGDSDADYLWDFGDGTTATGKDVVHNYTKYGSYTVTQRVLHAGGCNNVAVKTNAINIQPLKITGISGLITGCVPFSVKPTVQTSSSVPVAKYYWDFGDGTTSTDASPRHTYTKEGIFNVKVKIETEGGCTDSLVVADSAGHHLKPSFTVSPTDVCASTEVAFVNTTQEQTTFLWWYLGDGTIVYKLPNPSHNYRDTGKFTVKLVVENNGCYDTIVKKNAVHISGPIAKFGYANECDNKLRLTIKNNSIDDRTRRWDFGDGTTDTARSPVHIYKAAGNYTVKLFVANGTCTYKADSSIKIVNENGLLSITDSIGCRATRLNYAVSNVNADNIQNTIWHFTGNSDAQASAQGPSLAYAYGTTGSFRPYVEMVDILGCRDTLRSNHLMTIYGPTAKFNALETGACKNSTIHFTDTSLTDGLHPITSWAFNYGSGNPVKYTTNTSFKNTYKDTGVYTVTMAVKDSYGCTDTFSLARPVLITKPYASFKLSDTLVCPGKQVAFTSTSAGVGLQYNWNIGDGSVATAASFTHLYTTQGAYTPTIYVTDINNCKDSASAEQSIRVFLPSARFLLSDSVSNCPPLTVNFNNQSANFATVGWDFGDGNTSNLPSPAHIYTYPGVYPAKVYVTGNGGCADSAVKNITIKGPTGTLQYAKTPMCYPATQAFKAVTQNAVQFLWDYSDGKTKLSDHDTSTHIYLPGAYLPKLILVDKEGCKVPIRGLDTLKVFDIKTRAVANNYLLCDSGKVTFSDSSITNDGIAGYKWIFDDNTTATGASVMHQYTSVGLHNVTLISTTVNGCTDSAKLTTPVKVVQSPVVAINGASSYCAPATVSLQGKNNIADTSALTWAWDFGNGAASAAQNPSGVNLNTAGNYTVKAVATNSSGCQAGALLTVTVHAQPNVKANADTVICRFGGISLQASGASAYTWSGLQSISCTNCASPIARPDSTAMYTVTGKDEFGCTATDSVTVRVSQPVHVSLAKSDTLCNGETRQLAASGATTYKWFPAVYLSDDTAEKPTFRAVKDTAISYQVIGYDEKRCFTDTATIKVKVYPIPQMQVVQNAVTASAGSQVTLSTINSADVTKWKWSPGIWLNNPNIASPTAQPRESITYTVVAANDGACVTRAQIAVTVICNGSNIFVPNTFSPNGDGVNEKFYPQGTGIYNIKSFRVFNRWGQMVFEKLNIGANSAADGWDGTFKGQKLQPDVFVYIIEVMCTNNTIVPVKGNITLIR